MQPKKPLNAADKAKGVLEVSSKFFLLPTRNDDQKNSSQKHSNPVWNMQFSGLGVKKQGRRYYNVLRDTQYEILKRGVVGGV